MPKMTGKRSFLFLLTIGFLCSLVYISLYMRELVSIKMSTHNTYITGHRIEDILNELKDRSVE